jgi:hypothetical protein
MVRKKGKLTLGHSEITTTQRYAKIVDSLRDKEMAKWNQLGQINHSVICPECKHEILNFPKNSIKTNSLAFCCNACNFNFIYVVNYDENLNHN